MEWSEISLNNSAYTIDQYLYGRLPWELEFDETKFVPSSLF